MTPTRSKAGLVFGIIASVITFGFYFMLTGLLGNDAFLEIVDNIGDRDLEILLIETFALLADSALYLGIANLVLAVLGWRFKVANVFLCILGWFYLICGGFILFLLQGIFCIVAQSKNKKYWTEKALIEKIEKEKQIRDAVEGK